MPEQGTELHYCGKGRSLDRLWADANRPGHHRTAVSLARQRLLEAESQGKTIEVNGHKAEAAAPAALPAPETQFNAGVGTENGIAARDQSPAPKQDPLSQWRESIRTAATWKTTEPENHAGMFGPYPEELE